MKCIGGRIDGFARADFIQGIDVHLWLRFHGDVGDRTGLCATFVRYF